MSEECVFMDTRGGHILDYLHSRLEVLMIE